MATLTTDRLLKGTDLTPVGAGHSVEVFALSENERLTLTYSIGAGNFGLPEDGFLSVEGGTVTITAEEFIADDVDTITVEGPFDGDVTLSGGEPDGDGTGGGVTGVTPPPDLPDGGLTAGGDITTTSGNPPTGGGVTPVALTNADAPDEETGEITIEIIGDDLFLNGASGAVNEVRVLIGAAGDPAPQSTTVFSDLALELDDIYGFLQSPDGVLSGEFQRFLRKGDDHITGGEGGDLVKGLGGDDTLNGGASADRLHGGDGFDFVTYADAGDGVRIDLSNAAPSRGDAHGDKFIEIEGVIGGQFDDHLRGHTGDEIIRGEDGQDRILGRAGDDVLDGGNGDDEIIGGRGADTMTGGEGQDTFIFYSHRQSGVGDGARDVITDYSREDGDLIDLSRLDADATSSGAQAFAFIGAGAFADAGQIRINQSSGDSTVVQADRNGDGAADFEIELTGVINLTVADFIF